MSSKAEQIINACRTEHRQLTSLEQKTLVRAGAIASGKAKRYQGQPAVTQAQLAINISMALLKFGTPVAGKEREVRKLCPKNLALKSHRRHRETCNA